MQPGKSAFGVATPLRHPGTLQRDCGEFGVIPLRADPDLPDGSDGVWNGGDCVQQRQQLAAGAVVTRRGGAERCTPFWSCCSRPASDIGCSVAPAARGDPAGPPADLSGRWALYMLDDPCGTPAKPHVSVSQCGRTVEFLSPVCTWSPATGTVTGNEVSVFGITAVYLPEQCDGRGELLFSNRVRWVRTGPLRPAAERLRGRLARFYLMHCRPRLRMVDALVEQYEGKDDEVLRFLRDAYWQSPDITAHAESLFGAAAKWWRCEVCNAQVNPTVAIRCTVCGARPVASGPSQRRWYTSYTVAGQGTDTDKPPPPPVLPSKPPPPPTPPDGKEVVKQLRPLLIHLGLGDADITDLSAKNWAEGVRPVPRHCLASLGREGGKYLVARREVEAEVSGGDFSVGDLCVWQSTAVNRNTEAGAQLRCRVLGVVPAQPPVAPQQYIVQFDDGSERVAPGARLRKAWDDAPPPTADFDAQPGPQSQLPPWHHAAPRREGRREAEPVSVPSVPTMTSVTKPETASGSVSWHPTAMNSLASVRRDDGTDGSVTPCLLPSQPIESGLSQDEMTAATERCAETVTAENVDMVEEVVVRTDAGEETDDAAELEESEEEEEAEEEPIDEDLSFAGQTPVPADADTVQPGPGITYVPPLGLDDFQVAALRAHDAVRRAHMAGSLTYCPRLGINAQRQAELCASLASPAKGHDPSEGQNVCAFGAPAKTRPASDLVRMAVDIWLQERVRYDALSCAAGQTDAHQFVQMVWRQTTHLGVGIHWSGGRCYVVANYRPPINTTSLAELERNVWVMSV